MRGVLTLFGLCLMMSTGCVMGPEVMKIGQVQYNKALQSTRDEQLLLNLVRLRYAESPVFFVVNSISTQYSLDEGVSASANILEGATKDGRDSMGVGGDISFAEKPTISYTPLQGGDFVRQMLTPMSLDNVLLLTTAGWSSDRVMRLTVQRMNGLDNASSASGPTPTAAPPYRDFVEASRALRDLQKQGMARVSIVETTLNKSSPLPDAKFTAEDFLEARKAGFSYEPVDSGGAYILTAKGNDTVLLIADHARGDAAYELMCDKLGLSADVREIKVESAYVTIPVDKDPDAGSTLAVATRSLLGVMFYLSENIETPECHIEDGLVTQTRNPDGSPFDWSEVMGDLFSVRVSALPPVHAHTKVQYRGYWYYISDSDISTKATFALLAQLFDLQAGQASGAGPVLTLPL